MNKASNKPYGLPMNIQFFADGADANIDQTGENGAQGAQEAAEQAKTYTEEELQSEINRAVQQRLARQKRDEEKRLEAARAEGRSEAEKLAQMSVKQRALVVLIFYCTSEPCAILSKRRDICRQPTGSGAALPAMLKRSKNA